MEYASIAVLLTFPVALLFIFKSNASFCFLVLCAGAFTAQYAVPGIIEKNQIGSASPLVSSNLANLSLITIPWILAAIFSAKTFYGKKLYLQMIPALFLGLCFTYLVSFYMPAEPPFNISTENSIFRQINTYFPQILTAGFLTSLGFMFFLRKSHKDKKHK